MPKQKVTLWLDSDIYQRTKEMVKDLPNTSVSSLVDELLDGITLTLQAPLAALGKGATTADAMSLFHGGVLDLIRTLDEEDEPPVKAKK